MADKKAKKPSYLKKILAFYFAPVWQSFFTIFYLIFFAYFTIFHSGKILVALNFLLYTFFNSTTVFALDYLFWGVIFIIGLIIPFSVSLYSIILFYEVWKSNWKQSNKFLTILAIILAVPLVIILMRDIVHTSGSQESLTEFVQINNLQI